MFPDFPSYKNSLAFVSWAIIFRRDFGIFLRPRDKLDVTGRLSSEGHKCGVPPSASKWLPGQDSVTTVETYVSPCVTSPSDSWRGTICATFPPYSIADPRFESCKGSINKQKRPYYFISFWVYFIPCKPLTYADIIIWAIKPWIGRSVVTSKYVLDFLEWSSSIRIIVSRKTVIVVRITIRIGSIVRLNIRAIPPVISPYDLPQPRWLSKTDYTIKLLPKWWFFVFHRHNPFFAFHW